MNYTIAVCVAIIACLNVVTASVSVSSNTGNTWFDGLIGRGSNGGISIGGRINSPFAKLDGALQYADGKLSFGSYNSGIGGVLYDMYNYVANTVKSVVGYM